MPGDANRRLGEKTWAELRCTRFCASENEWTRVSEDAWEKTPWYRHLRGCRSLIQGENPAESTSPCHAVLKDTPFSCHHCW